MHYTYASLSNVGARSNNEDALRVRSREGSLLAVVADGLGGYDNGELASRLAVDSIFRELEPEQVDEDTLAYSLLHAHGAVLSARNCGKTTAAALWLSDGLGAAAHVGDSRIYQFRDGGIVYQSQDHSMVHLALTVGEITAQELRHHKDRNKLFRVLGEENEDLKVDSTELDIRPGDRFLLCSDGFWEPVTEEEMLQDLEAAQTPQQWLDRMARRVSDAAAPKQDNYSAICIFAEECLQTP